MHSSTWLGEREAVDDHRHAAGVSLEQRRRCRSAASRVWITSGSPSCARELHLGDERALLVVARRVVALVVEPVSPIARTFGCSASSLELRQPGVVEALATRADGGRPTRRPPRARRRRRARAGRSRRSSRSPSRARRRRRARAADERARPAPPGVEMAVGVDHGRESYVGVRLCRLRAGRQQLPRRPRSPPASATPARISTSPAIDAGGDLLVEQHRAVDERDRRDHVSDERGAARRRSRRSASSRGRRRAPCRSTPRLTTAAISPRSGLVPGQRRDRGRQRHDRGGRAGEEAHHERRHAGVARTAFFAYIAPSP